MAGGREKTNFSEATKKIIMDRAAYECVVPGCESVTMGPGAASDQTASTGTACHIFSAARNGPRGHGGLSAEQLRNPENGVWACANHGRLIDTNSGDAYPATILYSWKALQEAKFKKARDGQMTNIGWLDNFVAENTVLFACDATLHLGKATLIQGPSFGKTALLDWISASLGAPLPDRWTRTTQQILTSLTAFTPEKRIVNSRISAEGLTAHLGDVVHAEVPKTISYTYIREGSRLRASNEDDDVFLGRVLDVAPGVVRSLTSDIQRRGTEWGRRLGFFREPCLVGYDDDSNELYSKTDTVWALRLGGASGISMRVLSGSEIVRVLIEFAMALARERSKTSPAVLLLDGSEWPLDDAGMDFWGELLPKQPFQTVMTAVGGWSPRNPSCWKQWKRYELCGRKREATIEQTNW